MWFSVVCTLIDNGTRHHSGQNLSWTRSAAPLDYSLMVVSYLDIQIFVCSNFLCGQTGKAASKKRKLSPGTSKNGGEEEDSGTRPGRAFVPFNYSDVDYSTFTGKKVQQENSLTCVTRIILVY